MTKKLNRPPNRTGFDPTLILAPMGAFVNKENNLFHFGVNSAFQLFILDFFWHFRFFSKMEKKIRRQKRIQIFLSKMIEILDSTQIIRAWPPDRKVNARTRKIEAQNCPDFNTLHVTILLIYQVITIGRYDSLYNSFQICQQVMVQTYLLV